MYQTWEINSLQRLVSDSGGQASRQRLSARSRAINETRARVEHLFARLAQLGCKLARAMTVARNALAIALKCVAYNAKRLVWLVAQCAPTSGPRCLRTAPKKAFCSA